VETVQAATRAGLGYVETVQTAPARVRAARNEVDDVEDEPGRCEGGLLATKSTSSNAGHWEEGGLERGHRPVRAPALAIGVHLNTDGATTGDTVRRGQGTAVGLVSRDT
jgi:hypothetical protein